MKEDPVSQSVHNQSFKVNLEISLRSIDELQIKQNWKFETEYYFTIKNFQSRVYNQIIFLLLYIIFYILSIILNLSFWIVYF